MTAKTLTKITLQMAISSVIMTMASTSATAATFTYDSRIGVGTGNLGPLPISISSTLPGGSVLEATAFKNVTTNQPGNLNSNNPGNINNRGLGVQANPRGSRIGNQDGITEGIKFAFGPGIQATLTTVVFTNFQGGQSNRRDFTLVVNDDPNMTFFGNAGGGIVDFMGQNIVGNSFLITAGGENPGDNDNRYRIQSLTFEIEEEVIPPPPTSVPESSFLIGLLVVGGLGLWRKTYSHIKS